MYLHRGGVRLQTDSHPAPEAPLVTTRQIGLRRFTCLTVTNRALELRTIVADYIPCKTLTAARTFSHSKRLTGVSKVISLTRRCPRDLTFNSVLHDEKDIDSVRPCSNRERSGTVINVANCAGNVAALNVIGLSGI